MSYWKTPSGKNYQSLDTFSNSGNSQDNNKSEFYEFEPAVVLDVVLDENHEIFKNIELTKLDNARWPADVNGEKPLKTDVDYSWIGRVLVRMVESQKKMEKEDLVWAYPLESNISEYPVINEIVIVVKYLGQLYYTRKLNHHNFVNSNEKFGLELVVGGFIDGIQKGNRELNKTSVEFSGPKSKSIYEGGYGFEGALGRYFLINKNIRAVKRHEGDMVFESRFGQSIKFSAYDDNRLNDQSSKKLDDYKTDGAGNPNYNVNAGGGNPQIVIRNRQRKILKLGQTLQQQPLPPIVGTSVEKNVGGYIKENINYDGSTIAMTSGMTVTEWATTCYKKMFQDGNEEQPAFSPNGCTTFKFPVLDGDQIVINSDRLILSARWGEMFQYSKKRFGIVTDSEYTVDAHEQIVLTTNTKTVINSPAIYLGQYNETNEPVLLGQTTISWLYELCNWLLEHTHWYIHSHEDAGKESPSQTQIPVQIQKLIGLRDSLHELLSRRVFVVGGGTADGADGGPLQ